MSIIDRNSIKYFVTLFYQVSAMMPPTSDTPLIGIYFSLIMVMVACSVVCTVLILNYNKRTAECPAMPQWIELVFLYWLPWILRMDVLLHKSQSLSSFQSEMKMTKTMNRPTEIKSKRFSGVFSQMPQEYLGSLSLLNGANKFTFMFYFQLVIQQMHIFHYLVMLTFVTLMCCMMGRRVTSVPACQVLCQCPGHTANTRGNTMRLKKI